MIKENRPKRKILLNTGVKSVRAFIKNKCITRLAKQRSVIKNKKLNLLIKPCTTSRKSNFNHPNGSSINERIVVNYPFIPAKLYFPSKKSREWTKLASPMKAIKPSIPAKPSILINKSVLANQITYLISLASYNMKVKSFIPDKPSVLINKSASENQVTYSRSRKYFLIPVDYIATNKKSNTIEKSILRIDRSTPVGACSFQKKDLKDVPLLTLFIPAKPTQW